MNDLQSTIHSLREEIQTLSEANKDLEEDRYYFGQAIRGVRRYLEGAWEQRPDAALTEACQMLDLITDDSENE